MGEVTTLAGGVEEGTGNDWVGKEVSEKSEGFLSSLEVVYKKKKKTHKITTTTDTVSTALLDGTVWRS